MQNVVPTHPAAGSQVFCSFHIHLHRIICDFLRNQIKYRKNVDIAWCYIFVLVMAQQQKYKHLNRHLSFTVCTLNEKNV